MFANNSVMLPDEGYIIDVFKNVVPFSKSNPEEVAAIRDWGNNRAVPAGEKRQDIQQQTVSTGRRVIM